MILLLLPHYQLGAMLASCTLLAHSMHSPCTLHAHLVHTLCMILAHSMHAMCSSMHAPSTLRVAPCMLRARSVLIIMMMCEASGLYVQHFSCKQKFTLYIYFFLERHSLLIKQHKMFVKKCCGNSGCILSLTKKR